MMSTKPTPAEITKAVKAITHKCSRCKHYTYDRASKGESCPDCERKIREHFEKVLGKVVKQQEKLPVGNRS